MSATASRREVTSGQRAAERGRCSLGPRASDLLACGLIVATTLVLGHDLLLTNGLHNPDLAQLWLPTYAHLGAALRSGTIPEWDPSLLSGHPFASDPQSGWMYLPPMVLSVLFSPLWTVKLMALLQPILAGCGLYAFLVEEQFGRVLAAAGGVSLAGMIAGSTLYAAIPFSATLAWMALSLWTVSRLYSASSPARRAGWLVAVGVCLGQAAAAHLSTGFPMTVAVVLAYSAVRMGRAAGSGQSVRRVLLWSAALTVGTVAINAAYFLPRLGYVPRTELHAGYAGAWDLGRALAGKSPRAQPNGPGTHGAWPLALVAGRGAHLAAVLAVGAVASAVLAFLQRRRRDLVVCFGGLAIISYALSLSHVAGAVPAGWRTSRPIDLYLHNPAWLGFLTVFALTIVAVCGLELLLAESTVVRLAALAAGALLCIGAAAATGAPPSALGLFLLFAALAGAAAAAPLGARAVIPVIVALELVVMGSIHSYDPASLRPPIDLQAFGKKWEAWSGSPDPRITTMVATGGRLVSVWRSSPHRWPRKTGLPEPLTNSGDDALTAGIETASGYEALVPSRYWTLVRALQPGRFMPYNRTGFYRITPATLDLLGAGWVVAPAGIQKRKLSGAHPLLGRRWRLWRVPRASMASLYPSWTSAGGMMAAIHRVAAPGFQPAREVVVERAPPSPLMGAASSTPAAFLRPSAGQMIVRTAARRPGMLLVRETYDPNWHASVDGHPAAIYAADGAYQAVRVPAGRHTIDFRYDDPSIVRGLLISLASLLVIASAAASIGWRSAARRGAG